MKLRQAVRKEAGFTLTEVLVSVGIVATLAAAVSPTVFQHMKESRIAKAKSDAATIASAIQRFRADMEVWPAQARGDVLDNVHGLLFSEAGLWPRIDLGATVMCDTGSAAGGANGEFGEATVDACDERWAGNFISWLPSAAGTAVLDEDNDPTGAYTGVINPNDASIAANCAAESEDGIRARIPSGSEFHSPASLDALLIQNMPALSRLDGTGTALYSPTVVGEGTADERVYLSMVRPVEILDDDDEVIATECNVFTAATINQNLIYPYKTDPGQAGWNGPYVASVPADPWGNKYLVNIHFGFAGSDHGFNPEAHENNQIMVLSAGPNGMIETPVGYHGSEDALFSLATGANVVAGGDDVVYVFNLSKRTTM